MLAKGASIEDFPQRIKELVDKSTQLLLFLTFGVLGTVTVMSGHDEQQQVYAQLAMSTCLTAAFGSALRGIALNNRGWYHCIVWLNFFCSGLRYSAASAKCGISFVPNP